MTRKILLFMFMATVMAGCNISTNKVKVADLYEAGKKFADQEVVVEATVMHICEHEGKKMFIAGKDLDKLVKVVPAGTLEKFDVELEGEEISITGIVKRMVIEEEKLQHGDADSHEPQEGEGEKKHCDTESKTGSCNQKEYYYIECISFEVKE